MSLVALNDSTFISVFNTLVCCDIVITAAISFLDAADVTSEILYIVIYIGNTMIFWVILNLVKGVCLFSH